MKKLYPQGSQLQRLQIKSLDYDEDISYVMCFKNIFHADIDKNTPSILLANENFFIPILEMESMDSYSNVIEILGEKHFHKPLMAIKNVEAVDERIVDTEVHFSQMFVGGLIMDKKDRLLFVREADGRYTIPNYRLEFTSDVYTKSVSKLLSDTAFYNLDRDLEIYPTKEGDNQAFDIESGVIINSNKGDFDYVNRTLFLTIFRVEDFDRLTIIHEQNKKIALLTLEEAKSLVNHPEVGNPWIDYFVTKVSE